MQNPPEGSTNEIPRSKAAQAEFHCVCRGNPIGINELKKKD